MKTKLQVTVFALIYHLFVCLGHLICFTLSVINFKTLFVLQTGQLMNWQPMIYELNLKNTEKEITQVRSDRSGNDHVYHFSAVVASVGLTTIGSKRLWPSPLRRQKHTEKFKFILKNGRKFYNFFWLWAPQAPYVSTLAKIFHGLLAALALFLIFIKLIISGKH